MRISQKRNVDKICFGICFITIFLYFVWLQATPMLADPDAFYHIKISQLMLERGLITEFPWLYYTTLRENFTDHHFLFHVILMPFVSIGNGIIGAKILAVLLATTFFGLTILLWKRLDVKYPILFTLLMLVNAGFIFRLSLLRALPLGLIIFFAGLYFIFKRYSFWLFLSSTVFVWAYGSWPILILAALVFVIMDSLSVRKITGDHLKTVGTAISGSLIGLIVNPFFPQNLYFYWQQIIQIGLFNLNENILVGQEWYSLSASSLVGGASLLFILLIPALILSIVFREKMSSRHWTLLSLSILFFGMTLKSARYIEYFVPIATWFIALTVSTLSNTISKHFLEKKKLYVEVISIVLVVLSFIIARDVLSIKYHLAEKFPPTYLGNASVWLKDNLMPEAIVLHTGWEEFPMLFFHNDEQYYIYGLDATFLYNYDPGLYWLHRNFSRGKSWDNLLVVTTFNVSAVLIGSRYIAAYDSLITDPDFCLAYKDSEASIFLPTKDNILLWVDTE